MHVHFVAVAGTGMGTVAGLFKAAGHDVTGSDVAFYPPMGPALERWGIRTMTGFSAENLAERPDLVVVGNVCRRDNPEARAAIDGGLNYTSMAHAMAKHLLPGTAPLVVGGTHGKTTTSSMCAWLLDRGQLEPGFLIGGLPKNFEQRSFRLARKALPLVQKAGEKTKRRTPFVIEGDEYDTAFFEKTPKFWHYRPEVAILTSIEHDHIDIYPDEASYLAAFHGFVERLPANGLLVAYAGDAAVVEVAQSASCPVAYYALEGEELNGCSPHWLAAPASQDPNGQSYDLYAGGSMAGRGALALSGRHNLLNATAAIAACCQGYGVPIQAAQRAMADFQGVARRQDLLGEPGGVRVYDDFAHHPTSVRETLAGLKARHRDGVLWAIYEPRTATACRRLHQQAYVESFDAADRVVFAPLGRSNIPDAERLNLPELAESLARRNVASEQCDSVEAIVQLVQREAQPGDTVAVLSNGGFGGIHKKLLNALATTMP
jgi:UDP-N-acetylmuramate: L-alanyl-gamma-D-glutamyl-meso-diaminopimelate ligase